MVENFNYNNNKLSEQANEFGWDDLEKYFENLKKKREKCAGPAGAFAMAAIALGGPAAGFGVNLITEENNPERAATLGIAAATGPVGAVVAERAIDRLPDGEEESSQSEANYSDEQLASEEGLDNVAFENDNVVVTPDGTLKIKH